MKHGYILTDGRGHYVARCYMGDFKARDALRAFYRDWYGLHASDALTFGTLAAAEDYNKRNGGELITARYNISCNRLEA